MTVARVALTELKRLSQGILPKLVLALMCVIPLLYSGIYMYGSWDPYNRMDDVKGALVMLDTGAKKDDGSELHTGADIRDELLEQKNFDWQEVSSKDDAVKGVTDGTYDFALIIDPDFSENLLTLSSFAPDENGQTGEIDPRQAGLEIITNDANNYVLTNIVKTAGTTVRDKVSSQVGDETAEQMLASFTTIHQKMGEAADGATQLADGSGQLVDGTTTLKEGTVSLSDGTVTLKDGTQQLADGASQLVDGQQQLADGANTLSDGAASANDGAQQISDGASTLNDKMGEAADGASSLADGAKTLNDGTVTLKEGTQSLADGASALADGTVTLSDGADKVADGASSLSDGASKLADGTKELNSTVESSGLNELAQGLQQVCGDLSKTNTSTATGDFGTDLSNTVVSDVAARTKENLAPLVKAGTLTQDQADKIVAQIDSEQTKSAVATRSEEALTRLKEGALSGKEGTAAADLAAMSDQLDALKSSSCATTGKSSIAEQLTALTSAISTVNDGAQSLSDGAATLSDGAASVADGAQTVEDNTAKLADGASTVNDGVAKLQDGSKTLSDGANTLADGAGQLADGTQTLADGSSSLADGTSQLADGADTLADGEATALDGQKSLSDGADQVNDGAGDLQDGASKLDSGAGDLQDGATQLDDGANELSDGLTDGTKQVPNLSEEDQQKVATTMSNPVNLNQNSLASGSNYGEGMGPFFMVLSLWVGMLMLVQTLRPMNTRALASNAPSLRVILGSWAPFALIGLVQATLVYVIVAGALGFNFQHPWLAFAFLCFVSLVYSGIIHGLVIFLGAPGKAVALVLLIIQLVTSGGTMPYETLPNSIRWLHDILPMGYALSGIRRIAYGIDMGGVLPQLGILLAWLFVGLLLGFLGTVRDRVWKLKALNPEIII